MYVVYILKIKSNNRYYIGHTNNLDRRLSEHSRGKSKYLRSRGPIELVMAEDYLSKAEAMRREKQLKRFKAGNAFKQLLTEKFRTSPHRLAA
ncbi:MAG: GIY-YIG nuclease family protein [Candidatus Omnitrophica bacterium]|nr:GIY-YIG nuclease family protein [Candidatus Omnitrophota bacterium]